MKKYRRNLLTLSLIFPMVCLVCVMPLRSQVIEDEFGLYEKVSMVPPLMALIDSALVHSPLLDQQTSLIRIREYQLKTQKIDWTRYVRASTDYRYGTIDNITVAPGGTAIGIEQALSSRFSIGTSLGFSLFDVLDQRRKVKLAQEQLEYEEYKMDEVKQLVTSEVIKLHSQLTFLEKLIPIKAKQKSTQETNLEWAKQAYEKGDIDIQQFSQVVETTTGAQEEFETVYRDFSQTWLLLEELVGSKLGSFSSRR